MMYRLGSNDFLGGFVAGSYVEAMGYLVPRVFGYFCECTIILSGFISSLFLTNYLIVD